ncbi:Gfo/Idh/MocA family protein [Sphingobium ummariense]|uniref:Oxidoreductase n=1 Tax=Sphingobium ummariense RL-3 TaxID=1346791 RepID=T0K1H6_9SPHN|nr:Gfo/Idh/MocA family oxidoreductase [Sphingobium ummariense]EQB30409.1 hypothetical protein M529_18835 [Sphingobium ummariense RL-3]
MSVMPSATPLTLLTQPKPLRLGFLGTGWIGRHRMAALAGQAGVEVAALSDRDPVSLAAAQAVAADAAVADDLDELLAMDLDGIVIATPSALHAAQAIKALCAGVAVFCQKPLGRNAAEVEDVIEAARINDRLLGVDMSYRFTAAMKAIRGLVREQALGRVHSIDLQFHNAYGPDKPWFYDPLESGGGCVMDLGIHLVDLALWTLGFPAVTLVESDLKQGGKPLCEPGGACEDHAFATLRLADGATVRLACSWGLHAGQDAVISAAFYGTQGGARLRNIGGSFYDFMGEHMQGTQCVPLSLPPDDWGGRAAIDWARRLAEGRGFDPASTELLEVARVLDRIYAGR